MIQIMTLAIVLMCVLMQDTNLYSSGNLMGSGLNSRLRGQALSTVRVQVGLNTAICHSLVVVVVVVMV